jgi:tripartite-type tricarboxylate transporter receptor subunit TctC
MKLETEGFRKLAMRRTFAVLGIMCGLLVAAPALSETYPDRPVKLVVPFPPGSSTDQIARLIGNKLQQALGQPFVVENRAGAAGSVAANYVAKSTPDGYTLLVTTNSLALDVSLFDKLPYDPVSDFAPVARIGFTGFVAMVRPDSPAKTVADLIALARAQPGMLSAGHSGSGSQVSLALLSSMANVNIVGVPYRGVPQAVTDLLGGSIYCAFVDLGNAAALTKSGQLIPLGETLPRRTDLAPGVPTIAETLPGYEVSAWFGLVAPAGTPQSIIRVLHDSTVSVLAMPDVRDAIGLTGTEVATLDPSSFAQFIKSEIPKWAKLVKLSGIHAE